MKNTIKIKFLGTAANGGVPQIDCRCKNCKSTKVVRKRNCILVETNGRKLVVDCGPDFHSQLIENNLRLQDLSCITISHLHWDHSAGLFDLSSGKVISVPLLVHSIIRRSLLNNNTFNYIFKNKWAKFSKIREVSIKFVKIKHDPNFPTFAIKVLNGSKQILIATDIFKINKKFLNEAKKSNLIIFDSTFLTESKHWHMAVMKSAPILANVNKNVIYTHINHSENVKSVTEFLVKFGFRLAFDGMEVKI